MENEYLAYALQNAINEFLFFYPNWDFDYRDDDFQKMFLYLMFKNHSSEAEQDLLEQFFDVHFCLNGGDTTH